VAAAADARLISRRWGELCTSVVAGVGVVPGTDGKASKRASSKSGEGNEPAEETEVQDDGRVDESEPGKRRESFSDRVGV